MISSLMVYEPLKETPTKACARISPIQTQIVWFLMGKIPKKKKDKK